MVSPHVAGLAPTIGRDTELTDLRAAFNTSRVQVLAGMGGVGKTSLARAYAQRHLDDYRIVWWVRAEDPSAADAEFRDLLEVLLPPGEAAKVRNARTVALAHLAKQPDPWLLVLDNVPDADLANGLLPPAGDGHILITTRFTAWPDPILINPLETEAAVELLTGQSGVTDRKSAESLAAELGGLPLALTQAAGFVRANGIDLATYLRLYRDRSAELHKEGRPADYPHTVATTWRLAMDRLTDPAREMLNVFAFCAPDAIPVRRIFGAMDELARLRAVGELLAHSLVTPAGTNAVTVHRLVQCVTRDHLGPEAYEWADKAPVLLMAAAPKEQFTETGYVGSSAVHRHLYALLDHLPLEHRGAFEIRSLLAKFVDSQSARDLLAELLPVQRRVLGADHPDTLKTLSCMAYTIGVAGEPARARDLLVELLPARERVLGAEHRETLITRYNLAHWTDRAGDVVGARDLLDALLPIQKRVLGIDHADTLTTWHSLADRVGEAGDAARARDLLIELLPHAKRRLYVRGFVAVTAGYWDNGRRLPTPAPPIDELAIPRHELVHLPCVGHNLAYWAELAGGVDESEPGRGREG